MKTKRLIKSSWKGLLIYVGINVFWGLLYHIFGTVNFSSGNDIPNFWESIYFSFVTSATIGYGDIISQSVTGQVFIILQSMTSILFIGVFGGYMAYQFLKRPKNILLSDCIYLKPLSEDILFTLRVGNKGNEIVDAKLGISIIQINNNIKQTLHKEELSYSLLEKSWLPSINLSNKGNHSFLFELRNFYNNPQNSMIRIIITGTDIETGEVVGLYKYYKFNMLKISGKFIDLYSWKKLERMKPNWSNFNKTEKITQEEEKRVVEFLER